MGVYSVLEFVDKIFHIEITTALCVFLLGVNAFLRQASRNLLTRVKGYQGELFLGPTGPI